MGGCGTLPGFWSALCKFNFFLTMPNSCVFDKEYFLFVSQEQAINCGGNNECLSLGITWQRSIARCEAWGIRRLLHLHTVHAAEWWRHPGRTGQDLENHEHWRRYWRRMPHCWQLQRHVWLSSELPLRPNGDTQIDCKLWTNVLL